MDQMAMAGMSVPLVWPFAPAATAGDPAALAAPADAAAPADGAAPADAAAPAGRVPWAAGVPTPARGTRVGVSDFGLVLAAWLAPGMTALPGMTVPPGGPAPPTASTPPGGPAPPGWSARGEPPAAAGLAAVPGMAAAAGLPLSAGLSVPVGLPGGSGRAALAGAPGAAGGHAACAAVEARGGDGVFAAPVRMGEPGCGGVPCSGAAEASFPGAKDLPAWGRWPPGGGGGAPVPGVGDPVPAGVPDHDGGGCAAGGWQSAPVGRNEGAGGIRVRVSALAPAGHDGVAAGTPAAGGGGPAWAESGGSAVSLLAGAAATERESGPVPATGGQAGAAGGYGDHVREAASERRQRVEGMEPEEDARDVRGGGGAGAVTVARTEGAGAAHLGGDRAVLAREPGGDRTGLAREPGAELLPGLDQGSRWPGHRPAEVEVEVDAGDLGQVTVRVAERHGTVVARFLVEGSTVSQLLERNMPELHARLVQAGLVPGQLEVSLGGSGDRGRRGSPSQGQEPLRVGGSEPVSRPTPAVGVSARTGAVVAPAGTGRGLLDVLM